MVTRCCDAVMRDSFTISCFYLLYNFFFLLQHLMRLHIHVGPSLFSNPHQSWFLYFAALRRSLSRNIFHYGSQCSTTVWEPNYQNQIEDVCVTTIAPNFLQL